jgi:TRAP-type uncharacterized transport system fused permease subunit
VPAVAVAAAAAKAEPAPSTRTAKSVGNLKWTIEISFIFPPSMLLLLTWRLDRFIADGQPKKLSGCA